MLSKKQHQAAKKQMATMKSVLKEASSHYLFEDREEDRIALEKAEADMVREFSDLLGELSEQDQKRMDIECDQALEEELKKNISIDGILE